MTFSVQSMADVITSVLNNFREKKVFAKACKRKWEKKVERLDCCFKFLYEKTTFEVLPYKNRRNLRENIWLSASGRVQDNFRRFFSSWNSVNKLELFWSVFSTCGCFRITLSRLVRYKKAAELSSVSIRVLKREERQNNVYWNMFILDLVFTLFCLFIRGLNPVFV